MARLMTALVVVLLLGATGVLLRRVYPRARGVAGLLVAVGFGALLLLAIFALVPLLFERLSR